MSKMSKTCFLHKRGRHTSYGRADTQLLHDISIRIQWNTSQTKKKEIYIYIYVYKLPINPYRGRYVMMFAPMLARVLHLGSI